MEMLKYRDLLYTEKLINCTGDYIRNIGLKHDKMTLNLVTVGNHSKECPGQGVATDESMRHRSTGTSIDQILKLSKIIVIINTANKPAAPLEIQSIIVLCQFPQKEKRRAATGAASILNHIS